MYEFKTLKMGLGLGYLHNQFRNASVKVDEIKVNLKVLNLETICDYGSHVYLGECWNDDVE
jgi:lipoate synthase